MSWPRTRGCAYRWRARTRRIVLWCGRLGRTQAETRHHRQYNLIMELSSDLICMRISLFRDFDSPWRRAYCRRTRPRISASDVGSPEPQWASAAEEKIIRNILFIDIQTITSCPVNCFVASSLVFTNLLMSLSSLFPKSCKNCCKLGHFLY